MEKYFDIAKYGGRWAVINYTSRTFSHIGEGKKNCKKIADQLNKKELLQEELQHKIDAFEVLQNILAVNYDIEKERKNNIKDQMNIIKSQITEIKQQLAEA